MIVVAILLAIAGGVTMKVGSTKLAAAKSEYDFLNAMTGMYGGDSSPAMRSAIAMGHVGLGVLIFGLALLLCGIVVAAVRRA